jgi:O-antigen/teichoic acid export membrane protein
VILDLITVKFLLSYATRPIQVFGLWGMAAGGLGFVISLYYTILRLFFGVPLWGKPGLILALTLLFIGVQLICIGLLGEMQVRTYHEAQDKPIYTVRTVLNRKGAGLPLTSPANQGSPLSRAGRNLLYKSAGEILARLCLFSLFIFAARVLGASEYGRYCYAGSVAALALIGMDLGLNLLFVRDGARDNSQVPFYAGTLLILKCCLAALVALGMYFYCLYAQYSSSDTLLIMLAILSQSFLGITELGIAGLNSLERMDQEVKIKAFGRLAALLIAGSALLIGLGIWGLIGGMILANVFGAIFAMTLLARHGGFKFRLKRGFVLYLFKSSLPLVLVNIFVLVYFRVDIFMLERMGESYQRIGWYAAGLRIVDAASLIPTMLSVSMLPILSSLQLSDPIGMKSLFQKGQRLLLLIGLPAAAGIYSIRAEAAVFMYGPEYGQSAQALAWLAPAVAILFLNHMQLCALTALGRQRLCAMATGLCVMVNIGLNLLLIPPNGFAGAAQATLGTEICLFALCAWFISKHLGATGLGRQAVKPALAALAMALILWGLPKLWLPLMVGLGMLIYAAILVLLGGVNKQELRELVRLLPLSGAGLSRTGKPTGDQG